MNRATLRLVMRTTVVALVGLVALAGCLQPTTPPERPGGGMDDAAPPFTLGEVTRVAPKPNSQTEAAVSVSPDGRVVLTCFHGFFQETSPGYASTDGGRTWRAMEFPAEAGVGGDCETALLEDGSWVFLSSTVAGATVLVSRDEGDTWLANPLTAVPLNGLADRPWIEAVGDEIWLVYMPLFVQPGTVGFTKSTDHGETWSTPTLVGTPPPERPSVRIGHPAVADGAVHIPLVRHDAPGSLGVAGTERSLQVATTTDGGATWSIEEVRRGADVHADWPSMAVTGAGDLLVAYAGDSVGDGLHVLHRPPGGAWGEPVLVHDADGAGVTWPWIDGGRGRNATFIVRGALHEDAPHVWVGRIDAATMTVQQHPVGKDPRVEFASLDHDAGGRAHAVWTDADAQYFVKSL